MNKQVQSQSKKNIEENLRKIIKDIENGRKYIKKNTIIMDGIRLVTGKFYDDKFEKYFYVDDNYNGCKT